MGQWPAGHGQARSSEQYRKAKVAKVMSKALICSKTIVKAPILSHLPAPILAIEASCVVYDDDFGQSPVLQLQV